MSRWFIPNWFLPKKNKRGDRGIVSRLLGGVGEIVFSALLCLTGIALGAMLITVQVAVPGTDGLYYNNVQFTLRLVAIAALISVGGFRVIALVWSANCSKERRSAIVDRVRSREAKHSAETLQFPTVPLEVELNNSPGTQLRYRLPSRQSADQNLTLSAIVCFSLIGIASMTSVLAYESIERQQWDWLMLAVSTACLVGAVWSSYLFLKNLIRAAAIGPTTLEVSDHPLFPGQSLRIYLRQAGRLRLRRLEVFLVCIETAVYQQGTNVRTESREVYLQRIYRDSDIEVQIGSAIEREITFEVPGQVMHSFRSGNNTVLWKIRVRGLSSRWAKFERHFPVIIYPQNPQEPRRA